MLSPVSPSTGVVYTTHARIGVVQCPAVDNTHSGDVFIIHTIPGEVFSNVQQYTTTHMLVNSDVYPEKWNSIVLSPPMSAVILEGSRRVAPV